jgi:predicted DNA-binding protein (UPF0251 family)
MSENSPLSTHLVSSLSGPNLGLCVKNENSEIQFQNQACAQSCGEMTGKVCEKGCSDSYFKSLGQESIPDGIHYLNSSNVDGSVMDSVIIKEGSSITTAFYPRKESIEAQFEILSGYNLSGREKEILQLVLQRVTRKQIAEQLNISFSTLKTHLNNIYKKLPREWSQRLQERKV